MLKVRYILTTAEEFAKETGSTQGVNEGYVKLFEGCSGSKQGSLLKQSEVWLVCRRMKKRETVRLHLLAKRPGGTVYFFFHWGHHILSGKTYAKR